MTKRGQVRKQAQSPVGTVTFIATHIADLEKHLDAAPDLTSKNLGTYRKLAAERIVLSNGFYCESESYGDRIVGAFSYVADAVECIMRLHRLLAKQEDFNVAIKAGVCSGEARFHEGRYSGIAITRAVELSNIASGRQTLTTNPTASLIYSELPVGLGLVPLGNYKFRHGLATAPIFQVTHSGYQFSKAEFEPLDMIDIVPGNASPVELLGRDQLRGQVIDTLGKWQFVNLTGIEGVGKSFLAQSVAWEDNSYRDGSWRVDLTNVTHSGVVQRIASSLNIKLNTAYSPEESLLNYMGPMNALLVFDNADGCGAKIKSLCESLKQSAPEVRVLVTSRAPAWEGMGKTIAVPPLPTPSENLPTQLLDPEEQPALKLLEHSLERNLDGKDLAAAADLVRDLFGVPQAIVLAAKTIGKSPIESLALQHRQSGGAAKAVSRALDAAISKLSKNDWRLLESLRCFCGSWSLSSAVTISRENGLAEEASRRSHTALAELGLIVPIAAASGASNAGRFALIPPLAEMLQSKLPTASKHLERLHAEHFSALCLYLNKEFGGTLDHWMDEAEPDYENILAAIAFLSQNGNVQEAVTTSLALRHYWLLKANFDEGIAVLDGLTKAIGDEKSSLVARLYNNLGILYAYGPRHEQAISAMTKALEIANEVGDQKVASQAHSNLGLVYHFSDRPEQAKHHYLAGYESAREQGDEREEMMALQSLLGLLSQERDSDLDLYMEEAHRLAGVVNRPWSWASLYATIGTKYLLAGDSGSSEEYFLRALWHVQKLGSTRHLLNAIDFLARCALHSDPRRSARLLGAIDKLRRSSSQHRLPRFQREIDEVLQELYTVLGEEELAHELFWGAMLDEDQTVLYALEPMKAYPIEDW